MISEVTLGSSSCPAAGPAGCWGHPGRGEAGGCLLEVLAGVLL